jgi:hypothetical protein
MLLVQEEKEKKMNISEAEIGDTFSHTYRGIRMVWKIATKPVIFKMPHKWGKQDVWAWMAKRGNSTIPFYVTKGCEEMFGFEF